MKVDKHFVLSVGMPTVYILIKLNISGKTNMVKELAHFAVYSYIKTTKFQLVLFPSSKSDNVQIQHFMPMLRRLNLTYLN